MTRRRGRAGQAGAETLELVAALPLLGLVLLVAWQGVALARQQGQAQADARELARLAVLCARAASTPVLADVDPLADGRAVIRVQTSGPNPVVTAEVRLVPEIVLPGFHLDASSAMAPHAQVVMRHEPC